MKWSDITTATNTYTNVPATDYEPLAHRALNVSKRLYDVLRRLETVRGVLCNTDGDGKQRPCYGDHDFAAVLSEMRETTREIEDVLGDIERTLDSFDSPKGDSARA